LSKQNTKILNICSRLYFVISPIKKSLNVFNNNDKETLTFSSSQNVIVYLKEIKKRIFIYFSAKNIVLAGVKVGCLLERLILYNLGFN